MKYELKENNSCFLEGFAVKAKDRQYQFWERYALSIDLFNEALMLQKINNIYQNLLKARVCNFPEKYKYSYAKFYETGVDGLGFLEHING